MNKRKSKVNHPGKDRHVPADRLWCPVRFGLLVLACGWFTPVTPAAGASKKPHSSGKSRASSPVDIGVDTGIVNSPTALFVQPDGSTAKIGSLRKGDLMVLVSREKTGDWLNVVQFSTGRQGWVKANRLITHYTRHPIPNLDLRSEFLNTTDPPSLQITNDSEKGLYLHLGTLPEIYVKPHVTQAVTVPPGFFHYNAAAADVLPKFGSSYFVNGTKYTWSFFIRPATTRRTPRPVDPALVAEGKRLQAEVDVTSAEVEVEKRQIDADEAALDLRIKSLKRRSTELENQRQTLDRTDQSAIDAFNEMVGSINSERASIQEAEKRLDAAIEAYNTKIAALRSARERLDKIADSINAPR